MIKLKANQPKLLEATKSHCKQTDPLDEHRHSQSTRNRREKRHTQVFTVPSGIDEGWSGLQRVVRIERSGRRGSQPYEGISYYITSRPDSAARLAGTIRGHWGIENRLHWVKDVCMDEDSSGIGNKQAAVNLSLLKSWSLTLYRRNGYDSLTKAIDRFTNKVKELLEIMRT
jgi:predicted transposase YbfD/YdcC